MDTVHQGDLEGTKSRPKRSNDDELAECKNGAVVERYSHIRMQANREAVQGS
jgi:hypothetical protein